MRVLLLSAYDALSHRYWREGMVENFPDVDWTVLSLPPRYFNFRVRTNPISWLLEQRVALEQDYDLLIATSLVDIVTLRGLFANLAHVPLWLYCHENQFAYPSSTQTTNNKSALLEPQMVFLYGCLCADAISFNSEWNRSTALAGMRQLVARLPEKWSPALLTSIANKADILPVPLHNEGSQLLSASLLDTDRASSDECSHNNFPLAWGADRPCQLIWNHRWEYDKGPEHLLALIIALQDSGLHCTIHVVGQQFRQWPQSFEQIKQLLSVGEHPSSCLRMGQWGFVESRIKYVSLLKSCDVVLSTALHDFQGIAILEAAQQGCLPLLPNQLVYPEQFAAAYLYDWHPTPAINADAIVAKLCQWQQPQARPQCPTLDHYAWSQWHVRYDQKMTALAANAPAA
jgi:glycosyltransferase involved in cell wall biosynthesis